MQRRVIIGLSLVLAMMPLSSRAQGFAEFGGVNAASAGLGAGLAASQNGGALVKNTYKAAANVQISAAAQTKAIQQYISLGIGFEAKKQWVNAEDAFTSALKWICQRDGTGSQASVPALQHLAKVSKAQNKIDQAIGYQKTVVAFAKRARTPDPKALVGADRDLSDMYVQKGDYADAEPILREAVAIMDKTPSVPPEEQIATLKVYGRVLRELNKTSEADAVDASLAAEVKSSEPTSTATGAQSTAAAQAGAGPAASVVAPAAASKSGTASEPAAKIETTTQLGGQKVPESTGEHAGEKTTSPK